jgi:SAM-dependent methyltransferase
MPSIDWNRAAWGTDHEWASDGDEWAGMAAHCGVPYPEWKRGLIEAFLLPYVGDHRDVIEIAPGHGRWSETLIATSRSVHLVDLNPECIEACQKRFADATNVTYSVTDGSSIPAEDRAADFVWSFDSFVHIDPEHVFAYLGEIARVLRPGGYSVIHHADKTAAGVAIAPKLADYGKPGKVATRVVAQHKLTKDGNRSNLNGAMVAAEAEQAGLRVVQQTDRWGPGGKSTVTRFRDVISIFHLP